LTAISQVNVEEDTEVAHSGYGSDTDSVTNEVNRSESDEEDREPPVHTTDTFSERKRKSSAASDASITQ